MRKLGDKKTRSPARIGGHQDCGICHPAIKNGRAKARREDYELAWEPLEISALDCEFEAHLVTLRADILTVFRLPDVNADRQRDEAVVLTERDIAGVEIGYRACWKGSATAPGGHCRLPEGHEGKCM